jgi:hypothetical protein
MAAKNIITGQDVEIIGGRLQVTAAARGTVVGSTSAPTTSSGTPAVIPEMTVTKTTLGGVVLVLFSGSFTLLTGDAGTIALYLDAVLIPGTERSVSYTSSAGALDPAASISASYGVSALLEGVAAGSRIFDVRWSASAGSLRAITTRRSLSVAELPL